MFGDNGTGQVQSDGAVPPLDPSVMTGPAPVATDDQSTGTVYADQSSAPVDNPVLQMHQEAVAASQGGSFAAAPADDQMPAQPVATDAHDEDLMAIKADALTALTPLVGSLEQTAEEKFRTTMMLIQASDDRTLVRQAYEAAQAIEDEKVKAQALLDVVNEINYFTSHTS
jgi:hypothetical protein